MQRPRFNAQPPSQTQPTNATSSPRNPQVFLPNPALGNLCSMLQNSVPQLMNPQIQFPNSNTLMPNFAPFIAQQQQPQTGFYNHSGMPQMGFAPQNPLNNVFLNQLNPSQLQSQFFPFNFSNFPQQLNQNPAFSFPNLHNAIQNLHIQMPNLSQNVGRQNPNFLVTGPQANMNQQVKGNTSQMPDTRNSQYLGSFKSQGNPVNNGQNSTSSPKWKKFQDRDFRKNPKQESSKMGYQQSQFNHMNNSKRKFGEHKGKGHGSERPTKFGRSVPVEQAKEMKRSLALMYTEEEIKRWREARRKNFPSKANIEKKCSEKLTNTNGIDREAKLRREQLKEILAKQAELGVEIAEIPSYYLSGSATQEKEKEDQRSIPKKGRFRNKHDRRGRYNKKYGVAKQNTVVNGGSSHVSSYNKRKPTLLQTLLSADIRKDKHHLLQAFRFIVMNSFFEDQPEKPLEFPTAVVKEDTMASQSASIPGKSVSDINNKKPSEDLDHCEDSNSSEDGTADGDGGDKPEACVGVQGTCYSHGKCSLDKIDNVTGDGEIIN